jgi:L-ribulose-5-phosphate 3-epimerase
VISEDDVAVNLPPARRQWLGQLAAWGSAFLAAQELSGGAEPAKPAPQRQPVRRKPSSRRYEMKKSINLWAFPYPGQWTLKECFELAKDAGFDGVEINLDLKGEFSAESTDQDIRQVGRLAEKTGIGISGLCSSLFWPYPMTANNPAQRKKGIELAIRMVEATALVGSKDLLVVPGAVYASWVENFDPVPIDLCDKRAREAVRALLPKAEKSGVFLNIENIFVNGFLFSPGEMNEFVDSFNSKYVRIHFDTGNIMEYQFPEHWIPILGKRIQNTHLKESDKRTREFNLNTFRTLLDGTTNWPVVIEALDKVGYRGYLTFEYFHPFSHYPEALIYQTSDALDWMLGRKS